MKTDKITIGKSFLSNGPTVAEQVEAMKQRIEASNKAKPAQAAHSPLPWTTDPTIHRSFGGKEHKSNAVIAGGKLLGKLVGFSEQDAMLIVRAVNHADKLAEAIRNLRAIPNGIDAAFAALAAYEKDRA